MSEPVVWYKSQQFTALWQASLVTVLTWLGAAILTNDWTWRPTAAALLSNVAVALKDWFSPKVVAPLQILNRNNIGG